MKVCAEFDDQVTAMNAHKAILDKGAEADDIELRSPYPLAEEPIPAHRSLPMVMRSVVRLMWLCGIIGGFSFITFTQLEWGLTAKTDGHPLVAIPINAIIMYECGMVTAIWVTTFMFFIETRRYRSLVPPLEEDMPVANGYIALVVSGNSAKKAKDWLDGLGARNIVTFLLPLLFIGMFSTGCVNTRWDNIRAQQVIKPRERAAELPPPHSLRMPTEAEAAVTPPQPMGWLTWGDPIEYERAMESLKSKQDEMESKVKSGDMKRGDMNKQMKALRDEINDDLAPELIAYKGAVPAELQSLESPVPSTPESIERGKLLYAVNCSHCHGAEGQGDGKVGEVWAPKPPAIGGAPYASSLSDGGFYFYIMTGKNNMPPFGPYLNTHEVFDIVNYLRSLQNA